MNLLKAECINKVVEKKWDEFVGRTQINKPKSYPKITINIMVKNEERCIERCLQSVVGVADEIIIVDTGSTDQTLKIINSFDPSINIHHKKWNGDFAEIRNFMINISTHDWIFQLDADETLHGDFSGLKTLLAKCEAKKGEHFHFISPRIQDKSGLTYILTRRIFRKHPQNKYVGIIHEELRVYSHTDQQIVDLLVDSIILHDGYEKDVMKQKKKYQRNVKSLEIMIEREPDNPKWIYFLARDVFNGLEDLEDYEINDVKKLLYQTKNITVDSLQLEFIEAAYVLLGQILKQEGEWEEFEQWNQELTQRFPKNADGFYFDIIINQRYSSIEKAGYLHKTFHGLTENDATISKIDSNLSHLLYALASAHYENGDIQHAAFFLEELSQNDQESFIQSNRDKLKNLQQILLSD